MPNVQLKNIVKKYDTSHMAVDHFNLNIEDKEFIVFVGPSGCGKSTTLRMIAGLEEITSGDLFIDGERVNDVAPKDRDIAMVFQNYALYPHMSVYDNMAFGLKLRKFKKAEIKQRVHEAAEILGLYDYLNRKPKELSGGQRQRVALGRAIVRDAKVFLMDEPLSNLDAKLRVQMRAEIQKLHHRLGTTSIYVTHDQTEAMTMATRLVVMKDGVIQQVGKPEEVYENPTNKFVAGFIGSPAMNFLDGRLDGQHFYVGNIPVRLPDLAISELLNEFEGKELALGIRPENVHYITSNTDEITGRGIPATVTAKELMGADTYLHLEIESQDLIARVGTNVNAVLGDKVFLQFELEKAHYFDKITGEVIKSNKLNEELVSK